MYNEYDKINKTDKNKIPPSVFFVYKFEDIDKIIKVLDLRKDVILNVSNMEIKNRIRVIDFLSGFIFAKNGKREKLEDNIYLFTY